MNSQRHADTKARTERSKNRPGVMAGENIIRRTTLVRNLSRESNITMLISSVLFNLFTLWVVNECSSKKC